MSTQRLVDAGDVELYVETFGERERPTLLLVSGAAASSDWWDAELCLRLAAGGRHVVRYDHRDTGQSTTGTPGDPPPYDGAQLGRDCTALIEALDVGPVHLAGLSMGGGIAQQIALQRPDLVSSLTLISTTAAGGVDTRALPGPTPALRASFDDPPPEPDWADAESYADWVVAGQRPYTGTLPFDEPRTRAVAARVHARSHDPAAAGNHWLVVGGEDDGELLDVRRIATPTLVVHGDHDPLFPLPHGQALAAAIPGARLLVLPGTGHEVPPPATWDVLVPALLRHTAGR